MNNWKNETTLTAFIEDDNNEDFLDSLFFGLFEIEPKGLSECPYWLEAHQGCMVEYNRGYYEPLSIGDVRTFDGADYRYIDSQPLSEEVEHQADDGSLVYEYRGHSYLRIWTLVSDK